MHSVTSTFLCYNSLLQLYFEPNQGSIKDDTAIDGLEVKCRGPGMEGTTTHTMEQKISWSDSRWGSWSDECTSRSAVCSLQTRVEPDQGSVWGVDIDDGALTEAKLHCCEY